jgi:hypothetical protein
MTHEDIISMAREAGLEIHEVADWRLAREGMDALLGIDSTEKLQRFYALATAKEREARQAAQIENEELKARLARAGLEQQRAVMAEREACARYFEHHWRDRWTEKQIVEAIRARSQS